MAAAVETGVTGVFWLSPDTRLSATCCDMASSGEFGLSVWEASSMLMENEITAQSKTYRMLSDSDMNVANRCLRLWIDANSRP